MPVPGNLNWNLWMGPLNDSKIHYHPDLCPPISLEPEEREKLWGAWRWYRETGNGFTADWGAHMFDISQAAIGMDGSGPCEIIPKGYNGQPYLTFKYLNGIEMTEQPYLDDMPGAQGIKFIGTDGWIEVARGYLACSKADLVPAELAGRRPKTDESLKNAGKCLRKCRKVRPKVVVALKSVPRICRILLIRCDHARILSLRLKWAAAPIHYAAWGILPLNWDAR